MVFAEDITGKTFGRLTVLGKGDKIGTKLYWLCSCVCGGTKQVTSTKLKSAHTNSCGCLADESRRTATRTHGGKGTAEYVVWQGMGSRTTNPNQEAYAKYKDRAPPDIWKDFEVFLADVGKRPSSKHTLERVENDKPYGPGNTIWATRAVNNLNRENTLYLAVAGVTKPLKTWCEELGIKYTTAWQRASKSNDPSVILRRN